MKKIYKVAYTHGYSNQHRAEVHVLAKDAAQAVDHVKRYGKKKHYSEIEIVSLERVLRVDVEYRS